jgi:hypothetical protein
MRQVRGRVLQRHRAGQAEALLNRDVRSHAQATECRPSGYVVDYEHAPQSKGRLVHVDDLGRPEVVGKLKDV